MPDWGPLEATSRHPTHNLKLSVFLKLWNSFALFTYQGGNMVVIMHTIVCSPVKERILEHIQKYLKSILKVLKKYLKHVERFFVFCLLFQRVKNIEMYNHVWEIKHAALHGKQVYVYSHLKLKSN